jgi:carbon storage regulator
MLVLSRKLNETIIINGDIRVTVVSIHGNQVRLGIQAPQSVPIFREEISGRPALREDNPQLAASEATKGSVIPHSNGVLRRGMTRSNP